MRRSLVVLAALAVAGCQDVGGPDAPSQTPAFSQEAGGDVIPGRYIVTLEAGASRSAVKADHGVTPEREYDRVLNGFAGALTPAELDRLQKDPRVAMIEPDRVMRAVDVITQPNATWGLDRIDQRNLPLNATYTYAATGAGVVAHIIDTGIRYDHVDFGGRASFGFDAFSDGQNGADCDGHGTHVSGTVGGTTWGVAKNVQLKAVRVLNCNGSGSTSGVIAGVNWVATYKSANPGVPMVANMSLGGGPSTTLNNAVTNLIAAGVPTAVAAGNSNANACNESPASTPNALTVGSTTQSDARSSFSNWGSCVDLFAPGSGITSAYFTSPTAAAVISGTSMASPHVAGVAALYLQGDPGASAATVAAAVLEATTKGIVTNSNSANNHLLYSRLDLIGPPPDPEAPVAAIAAACSGSSCTFTDASTGPPTSWSWNFGNGQTSSNPSATATYSAAGTYVVTLVVSNALGSDDASGTVSCTGGGRGGLSCQFTPGGGDPAPPVASFSKSCSGANCTFTDTSTGAPTSWNWSFGNGGSATTPTASTSYLAAGAGTYTVTLTVSNSEGSDTANGSVNCVSSPRGGGLVCQ